MNFVAHTIVAARLGDGATTRFLLGAAAPDLARMAGVPVATEGPDDLLAGVAAHHRTDAVFHEATWFRERNRALVDRLKAHGVRRGPARGAGHVLVELLLDGALLADDHHAETFGPVWSSLASRDDDAMAMVPSVHHDRWAELLGRLTDRLEPARYVNPVYAADRTAGTLSFRPRLAMSEDEQATLRHVAADVHPDVRSTAPDVIEEIVGALRTA